MYIVISVVCKRVHQFFMFHVRADPLLPLLVARKASNTQSLTAVTGWFCGVQFVTTRWQLKAQCFLSSTPQTETVYGYERRWDERSSFLGNIKSSFFLSAVYSNNKHLL
jgi:hypothetical protein